MQIDETTITEADIARLVDQFYRRVRADPMIGPIFEAKVGHWSEHLATLRSFWSMVLLRKGDYAGRPLAPHLVLSPEPRHFDRWLELFEETSAETLAPDQAALVVDRAKRIADSFELAIGTSRGVVREPRHLRRPPPS